MYSRDIAILANSRKYGGHCIAGKDIKTKEWVRLICRRDSSGNTIPFTYQDLKKLSGDGNGPALFSCFRINFHGKCGIYCQPENELISGDSWQLRGYVSDNQWHLLEDDKCPNWLGDYGFGNMDNIPERICNQHSPLLRSLLFKKMTLHDNQLEINHKISRRGRIQFVLNFKINNHQYSLVITDITVEKALRKKELTEGPLSSAYVTVGVGQIYPEMKSHYKLVVGLVPGK